MNNIYKINGEHYRAEPTNEESCVGCAFDFMSEGCSKMPCLDIDDNEYIAKKIPSDIPIPSTVKVVNCDL